MNKFTVTVLDTIGIQDYIFGSNRLRENIGASYLVSQVTTTWVRETLEKLSKEIKQKVYAFNPQIHEPDTKPWIEEGELAAELVYAGGGNTVLLFSKWEYAKQFTKILSKKILEDAPGINLVAVHDKNFYWNNQALCDVVQNLMKNDLDAKKNSFITSSPLLSLGVTAVCNSTQLVAVGKSKKYEDEEPYLISREIQKKLNIIPDANQRLREDLLELPSQEIYEFPMRTDFLGRSKKESSYAAIVHADGNGIGDRFKKFGKDKENRDYIIDMRKLSHSVHKAGINALKQIINTLINSRNYLKDKLELKNEQQLPFRPLIYGGDDTTFVCDGRLGLELATLYLKALQEQPIADNQLLKACAGISIVKTHYPFARAYELSEQLCREAKKYVKDQAEDEDFSALDWHIAVSGLSGSIQDIREREYLVQIPDYKKPASLTMRPIRLEQDDTDWRSWEGFKKVVEEFNKEESYWQQRRNKIIQLREVLRKGSTTTKEFFKAYQLGKLPEFLESSGQKETLAKEGWLNGICGYFDVIEAMEFYSSLGEATNESLSDQNQATE